MKKIALLLAFFTLTACSENQKEEPVKSEIQSSTTSEVELVKNHQLEDVGMTYKEALEFDKFIDATNKSISSVADKDIDTLKKDNTLLEETYLNNGGNNLEKFTEIVNNDNFGFNKMAENAIENNRDITYVEAYGSLNYLLSFVDELGVNNGFDKKSIDAIKTYFLISITNIKPFSDASTDLLVNFK